MLDVPGEYVEPGSPTNPPLPTDRLPALTLESAAGEPVELAPPTAGRWSSTCGTRRARRAPASWPASPPSTPSSATTCASSASTRYDTASTMTRFAADRGVDVRAAARSRLRAGRRAGDRRLPGHAVRRRRRAHRRPDRSDRRRRAARRASPSTGRDRREPLRHEPRPVVPAGDGRRRQPVRLRAAADVPHVLPRPRGRPRRLAAGVGAPGAARVGVGDGRVHGRVRRRRRRSARGSRRGSSSTPSTSPALVGVALVVVGVAMLFGYKVRFATPTLDVGERDMTVRSMFVYGIAYAVVSLSCTLVLFIPTMFAAGERDGVVAGVVNGGAFALGMGLLVTALTVTLAVANHAVLRVLRSSMAPRADAGRGVRAAVGAVPRLLLLGRRRERGVRRASRTPSSASRTGCRCRSTTTGGWSPLVLGGVVVAAVVYVAPTALRTASRR